MAFASPRLNGDKTLLDAAFNQPPLKAGDSGRGVRIFQRALIDIGYGLPRSMANGSPDGIFGSETEAAVEQFQRENGLSVDGEAGAETLGRLDQILSILALEKQVEDQAQTGAPYPIGALYIT